MLPSSFTLSKNAGARLILVLLPLLSLVSAVRAAPAASDGKDKAAKYYFRVGEVKAPPKVDSALREEASKLLQADLAARPEWESDLGVGDSRDAQVAALASRKIRGFEVAVKLSEVKRDLKEQHPGTTAKRVGVSVRLEVLGVTLPGEKLAFSGQGDASGEIESSERRLDGEARALEKDLLKLAVKQAVDQAMLKLNLPSVGPQNEKRRKARK